LGQDVEDKTGENNAQVDCRCLCSDLGVISTGFAPRIPPSARPTGRSSPRSMRRRYAHGEWCLRENSRPPCRQQVCPRTYLLSQGNQQDAGPDSQRKVGTVLRPRPSGSIKTLAPMSRSGTTRRFAATSNASGAKADVPRAKSPGLLHCASTMFRVATVSIRPSRSNAPCSSQPGPR
jgi:hypothetical protein